MSEISHEVDPEEFVGEPPAGDASPDELMSNDQSARRLDPNVPSSLEQTLLMSGDIGHLLDVEAPALVAGADDGIRVIALGLAGNRAEARRRLDDMRQPSRIATFQSWIDYLQVWLERRADAVCRPQRDHPAVLHRVAGHRLDAEALRDHRRDQLHLE